MAQKFNAGLPEGLDLPPNFVIRVTAVSPVDGSTVTAVNVSNVAIVGDPITPDTTDSDLALAAPIFLPISLPSGG